MGDGRSHDAFPRPPGAMVSRSCNSTSTVRRGSLGLLFRCVAIDTRPSWSATAPGQGAGSAGDGAEAATGPRRGRRCGRGARGSRGRRAPRAPSAHEGRGTAARSSSRRRPWRGRCATPSCRGTAAVGTVSHTSSYGSAETISHTRPHRNAPARLRPRNRAPGTARVGAAEPLGADALVAPLADAGDVTDDVPHLVDVGVDRDRDAVLQLHAARWLRALGPSRPPRAGGSAGRSRAAGRTGGSAGRDR